MVFTRDLDPDEHVYANSVSSFLQQVGKASGRFLSKVVKEIKHRVRAWQARKKHKPPSFAQVPPWPCGRRTPPPELCDDNTRPVPNISSHQEVRKSNSGSMYRRQEGKKSYESMSQINPLRRLYVTNPDMATTRTAVDSRSISSSVSTRRSRENIIPPTSSKGSFRPIGPSQPRRPLEDIPEEPMPEPMPEPIAAESGGVHIPLSVESLPAQRVQDIDELWFTATSMETPGSPSVCSSPFSNTDQVFAPSSSQPVYPQLPEGNFSSTNSYLGEITPIRSLRSSRYPKPSLPPRIPSLYFRAGSPFADGNLPWNRTYQTQGK